MKYSKTLVSLLCGTLSVAHAQIDDYKKNQTQGEVDMTLAIKANQLVIEFKSPSGNFLEFEHNVRSKKDSPVMQKVGDRLKQAESLFAFDGTNCSADHVQVNISDSTSNKINKYGAADIHAYYEFKCEDTSRLSLVSLPFLTEFSNIQRFNVQWKSSDKNGRARLSSETPMFTL